MTKRKSETERSRWFNKSRFVYATKKKTKIEIEKIKKAWKTHSQYVRVVKVKDGYVLYTRKR